jgi:perosamine synthetase
MTDPVARFEQAFAEYVGAEYAVALCNGTATLHTALAALGVGPRSKVAVPPLTMSATTIAVLHAGAEPVFVDVDERTWLMKSFPPDARAAMGVSLYGLQWRGSWRDYRDGARAKGERWIVDDAAQTLSGFADGSGGWPDFKSYSFQASKILPLGEGGMLVTNDEHLAKEARSFSSLGYPMEARQPRIGKAALKHPAYARHYRLGWNYRMSPLVAERGLEVLAHAGTYREIRQMCADMYTAAIQGCTWLTPQHVPDGWTHDYWTYAVATDTPERCLWLLDRMEHLGAERPYPAWRLTYHEPAFDRLVDYRKATRLEGVRCYGICPVAESLQPRLVQLQTNNVESAARNARALLECLDEAGA